MRIDFITALTSPRCILIRVVWLLDNIMAVGVVFNRCAPDVAERALAWGQLAIVSI